MLSIYYKLFPISTSNNKYGYISFFYCNIYNNFLTTPLLLEFKKYAQWLWSKVQRPDDMSFPMQYDWWTYGQETKNHQALKTLQRIYLYSPYYPMYLVLLWNTVYWVQTYLLIRCIKPQSIHSSFIQDVNAYSFVRKISFRSLT